MTSFTRPIALLTLLLFFIVLLFSNVFLYSCRFSMLLLSFSSTKKKNFKDHSKVFRIQDDDFLGSKCLVFNESHGIRSDFWQILVETKTFHWTEWNISISVTVSVSVSVSRVLMHVDTLFFWESEKKKRFSIITFPIQNFIDLRRFKELHRACSSKLSRSPVNHSDEILGSNDYGVTEFSSFCWVRTDCFQDFKFFMKLKIFLNLWIFVPTRHSILFINCEILKCIHSFNVQKSKKFCAFFIFYQVFSVWFVNSSLFTEIFEIFETELSKLQKKIFFSNSFLQSQTLQKPTKKPHFSDAVPSFIALNLLQNSKSPYSSEWISLLIGLVGGGGKVESLWETEWISNRGKVKMHKLREWAMQPNFQLFWSPLMQLWSSYHLITLLWLH